MGRGKGIYERKESFRNSSRGEVYTERKLDRFGGNSMEEKGFLLQGKSC